MTRTRIELSTLRHVAGHWKATVELVDIGKSFTVKLPPHIAALAVVRGCNVLAAYTFADLDTDCTVVIDLTKELPAP